MGIPLFFGFHTYGRINQPDGTYRATKFFYLQALPIIPVGGVVGIQGQDPSGEAPIHFLSILVAYFKVYGFFFTLFFSAIMWKILDDSESFFLWPMGLLPIAFMSSVVASWFWIGKSPGWSDVKRTFVMLFTMVFFVGPTALPLYNVVSLHNRKTREKEFAAQAATAADVQVKEAGIPKLKAVSAAHKAANAAALGKCNDDFIGRLESSFAYIATVEAGYLAGLAGEGPLTREQEWLASRPLQVSQAGGVVGADILREVGNLNLMAVVHLDPPSPKGLSGYITIHHVTNGKLLCGVKVPLPARLPAKATDRDKKVAFIEAAQKALKGISSLIALKLDTPT